MLPFVWHAQSAAWAWAGSTSDSHALRTSERATHRQKSFAPSFFQSHRSKLFIPFPYVPVVKSSCRAPRRRHALQTIPSSSSHVQYSNLNAVQWTATWKPIPLSHISPLYFSYFFRITSTSFNNSFLALINSFESLSKTSILAVTSMKLGSFHGFSQVV